MKKPVAFFLVLMLLCGSSLSVYGESIVSLPSGAKETPQAVGGIQALETEPLIGENGSTPAIEGGAPEGTDGSLAAADAGAGKTTPSPNGNASPLLRYGINVMVKANVYRLPASDAKILFAGLPFGAPLLVYGTSSMNSKWYYVRYEDMDGYIPVEHVVLKAGASLTGEEKAWVAEQPETPVIDWEWVMELLAEWESAQAPAGDAGVAPPAAKSGAGPLLAPIFGTSTDIKWIMEQMAAFTALKE